MAKLHYVWWYYVKNQTLIYNPIMVRHSWRGSLYARYKGTRVLKPFYPNYEAILFNYTECLVPSLFIRLSLKLFVIEMSCKGERIIRFGHDTIRISFLWDACFKNCVKSALWENFNISNIYICTIQSYTPMNNCKWKWYKHKIELNEINFYNI